ncbi:hypothetical protein [Amycolatopsis sp. NPDC004625]|uniref:hypothetical protein n=1 Tax=Amycolatopsis sp. NPDC004625 TaxID=3154670 RepID=UPI0033ACFF6D
MTVLPGVPASVADFDALVVQRIVLPAPTRTFLKHAAAGTVRTVVELDDDLWNLDPSNRQAADFYTPEMLRNLERCCEAADAVTVTTDSLAERVARWSGNVHVVPNQVPAWLLEHKRPRNPDVVTIGWRGGTSHARDFGEIAKPLRRFLQHPDQRGRVEFHSMGMDHTPRVASRHTTLRHTGWHTNVADFLRAVDFDLSVVPLRTSVFNQSKSDLALVEMAALGIPTVTSDTGPYASAHGGPNVACSTPAQWEDALTAFTTDDSYRRQVGKAAKEWAATRTLEGNAWRWEQAWLGDARHEQQAA